MKIEKLNQAVAIAKKTQQVFIATADAAGAPHIACAGKITVEDGDRLYSVGQTVYQSPFFLLLHSLSQ
jgi:hypothetical protein